MGVTKTIVVPFAGTSSGSAGLTWGQQAIWRAFELGGEAIWLTGITQVPAGLTVADLADRTAYQLGRHDSLRTRLIMTGDSPVQQVVSASGELELSVVDTGDDDDPYQVAKAIVKDYEEGGGHYDYATVWPVRVSIVRHKGVPVYQVRALSHLVADSYGVQALHRDLAARTATGNPPGPVTAMQPLAEARWQASAAGQRHGERTAQYWERLLRRIPARRFPEPADLPQAHNCRFHFESRAAQLAIQAIAARTSFSASSVLLAALAVGMWRASGISPLILRIYVSNRFRPGLAEAVSPIAQTCPIVLDVAGVTFDEAVRRTFCSSLTAFKHAYFEPARIREVVGAVSAERGEELDVDFVCNDIRMPRTRDVVGLPVSPRDLEAALPLTTLTCEEREDPEDVCNFTFRDSKEVAFADAPPTIHGVVLVDDHYLPRSVASTCLRELENSLVSAAFDGQVGTDG